MEVDFSIIFNSRGRVDMLTTMLQCIEDTVSDKDKIETIVNFDDDDNESLESLQSLTNRFSFLKCLVNPREKNIHTNVNKMAFLANGKYIWALGDDCHIMTKGWDEIAKFKFERIMEIYPDGILLGAVESTSIDKVLYYGWYCDAPILTAKARDKLGYLIHPYYVSAGADVATWKIYSSVNRIIDMRDICFDHVTHNSVEALQNKDKTQLEYLERMDMSTFNPFTHDYSADIEQIKRAING